MISIRKTITDLEQSETLRTLALECYVGAIRNIAHYAVELDEITEPYKQYVEALAAEVEPGTKQALEESRATLRGLLRDYRDKASRHLNQLREELASTAEALQRILGTLSQSEDDHELRLRHALEGLRSISQSTGPAAGTALQTIADTIENSLDQLRQQHQLTVSQFLIEISLLHKRIHTLEAAASIDDLSRVLPREEMESRIRSAERGSILLLLKVHGFCGVETRFGTDVARELVGAFTKRLRNSVSPNAPIGRWLEEGFLVILQTTKEDALLNAKSLSSQLSGAYACLQNGKTVRPSIRVDAAVLDLAPSETEQTIVKIGKFLSI